MKLVHLIVETIITEPKVKLTLKEEEADALDI